MYTFLQVFVIRPFVWLFYGARITGRRNMPRTGSLIVAANHLSTGETVIMPSLLPRRVAFLAKAELFEGNRGPVSKLLAWFLKTIKMVPVDRAGGRDSLNALRHGVAVVENGGAVAMFPEGTRSPDGRMYKGKTGVARLALATGAPVIPIGLLDSEAHKLRIGIDWYVKPRIIVGKPLTFPQYAGRSEDRAAVRYVTDQIMTAIQEITGQEYVDMYASSVKYGGATPEEIEARRKAHPGVGGRVPPTNSELASTSDTKTADQAP